ncbi:hypothetical protein FDUTEX481_00791 [Tolypothrix sp. PCC 7601]|nr:hypothetical protein FDUTEX481_00791 [Tolypothrix sp. PCC 7601]
MQTANIANSLTRRGVIPSVQGLYCFLMPKMQSYILFSVWFFAACAI